MKRYRGLYFLIGVILYIMFNLVMFSHVKVFAHDITDNSIDDDLQEAIEIIDHENYPYHDGEGILIDKMDRVKQIYDNDEINGNSSDDIQDNPDDIQDNLDDTISNEINPVYATIIFSFGCVIGLIVGGMLLGWIK